MPHSAEICRGWAAKLAAVLPAELRRAFIADAIAGAGGIQAFIDDQSSSLLQAQLFLVLQRTHGGQRLESVVQRRIAEVGQTCQLVDAQRLGVMTVQPVDRPRNAMRLRIPDRDFVESPPIVAAQQPVVELPKCEGRKHADVARRVEQAHQPQHRLQQWLIHRLKKQAPLRLVGNTVQWRFRNELGNVRRLEIQTNTQIGRLATRFKHAPGDRHSHRDDQIAERVVHILFIAQLNLLATLNDHAKGWPMQRMNQLGRRIATDNVQRRNSRFINTGCRKALRQQLDDFSPANIGARSARSIRCIHEEPRPKSVLLYAFPLHRTPS
ncbi:Unknown protein sequence [Pseudomonas syringae pv. lapsa]|uniref:Uncharacterized protein n=1 Tax=Pseudomonas syringae pv. lapsa TaxID=199201 RepID=A0AB73ZZ24_PSESX|nr:Unknown protein sequence [Pseudomonas syringae pv. lapsa]RML22350.1 hypothetical protein ALQ98_05595 [Pseudomonas syringae pv. lapsa]